MVVSQQMQQTVKAEYPDLVFQTPFLLLVSRLNRDEDIAEVRIDCSFLLPGWKREDVGGTVLPVELPIQSAHPAVAYQNHGVAPEQAKALPKPIEEALQAGCVNRQPALSIEYSGSRGVCVQLDAC